MYHLWSAATQRPPWALFAALQSLESQVTREDYEAIRLVSLALGVGRGEKRARTQSLRQYSSVVLVSWLRK